MRVVFQIVLVGLTALSMAMGQPLSMGQVDAGAAAAPPVKISEPSVSTLAHSTQHEYQNPYLQHAPLAAFSLGSFAIGAVFYTLQSSLHDPKAGFMPKDRASLGSAVGAAGFTALLAGAAYFYYSNRDRQRAESYTATVSGNFEPTGEMNVSAAVVVPVSLPLSWLKF